MAAVIKKHEASVILPKKFTVGDLIDAVDAFHDVPSSAEVTVTKTAEQFDQRENSSWGGETTISAKWTA